MRRRLESVAEQKRPPDPPLATGEMVSDAAAEVRQLLDGVTSTSTSESVRRQLCQLVDGGLDGCILLLQVCLEEVLSNAGELKNFRLKHDLLSAIFRYCLNKTYFTTCFCEALRPRTATGDLLETLSDALELSAAEKVGIGLALSDSENSGMKLKGQQFSIAQIEELCSNPRSNDQIHEIVVFLHQTDVCQDVKILSSVLDSTPFAFSIKLAAAASRKDRSHIEKWLSEKLCVYKDHFLEECVNFLKEILSSTLMEQPQDVVMNIYWESCPLFVKVFESHSGELLSTQLLDELKSLYASYESRSHVPVLRDVPTSEGGSDDAEVEANAYFHLMFSEQISIDAMIQTLARFKESPEEREQSIFNCMISNLFEEYKFFAKYPDKQLKLAAVLFGSLIKHQLVAHLRLGAALCAVLDALRKSVDSKMFMFGTTALEQFLDRSIDWPQYCNDILQISHLRGTHAQMVSAIEGALAKISSIHNEPNVGNLLPAEQRVSGSSSVEAIEGFLGDRSHMGISQNKSILFGQPKMMVSRTHALRPRQFRCSTVRFGTVRRKLDEQVREMTSKCLLQHDSLDMIEKHIGMLLKDLQFSKDLILEEEQKLIELKSLRCNYPYPHCQPDRFEKEFGPVIHKLKTLSKSNDETLKDLKEGLFLNFNGNALLHQVKDILKRNKTTSKSAALIIYDYYDYFRRVNIEIPWLNGAAQTVEEVSGLLSGSAPVFARLESDIFERNRRIAFLSKERPQDFYSRCHALDTLGKLWEDIGILSKEVVLATKAAEDLCHISKNLRSLLREKTMYATRFHHTEQRLKTESSKVYQELLDLQREVEQARVSYKEKMDGLPEGKDLSVEYEKIIVDKAMSWRTRQLYGRNILGTMREQGLDMCAFVSTVVTTESLNKRAHAYYSTYSGQRYRPNEFVIKLSEYHLQDIVRAFYANNARKGSEKLDVCLERMKETGVVSENAYNRADAKAMEFARYRIFDFEKLKPTLVQEAFDILEDARVLIGTFRITKGYFSLGPDDVYDVPEEAVFETSAAGNILTHAIVIVGYGMTPKGIPYYIFQNWYGPTWGEGGFGKVTCHSIRQLYAANL